MRGRVNLIFLFVVTLFLVGCAQSVDEIHFSQDLLQFDENLRINLKNINTNIRNYEIKYDVNGLMNLLTLTDSIIAGMKRGEEDIKGDMFIFEKSIENYQMRVSSINLRKLSEGDRMIMSRIDLKINEYNSNKDLLNSCIIKMEEYRYFVSLLKDNQRISEKYDLQLDLLNEYVDDEKYKQALFALDELKITMGQSEANAQKRKDTGIQKISDNTLYSYRVLSTSMDLYRDYINLLINKEWDKAELKYDDHSRLYSEANIMGAQKGIGEVIDEIDFWFDNNIGVCSRLFRTYA